MRYPKIFNLWKRGKYWYYRTRRPDGSVTTYWSTGLTSKTLAERFCMELYRKGELLPEASLTVAEYAKKVFDPEGIYQKARGKKTTESTKKAYEYYALKIEEYFKDIKLKEVSLVTLTEFREHLLKKYSQNYTHAIIIALKQVFEFAENEKLINKSPFIANIGVSKVNKDVSFTREQIKKLVSYMKRREDLKLVMLYAITGMRGREAVGVTKADVKNENGIFYIDLTKQQAMDATSYAPLKTKKPRKIPIPEECIWLCDLSMPNYRTEIKHHLFKEIYKLRAENEGLTIHSIRHFFVTNAKSCGVNPGIVEAVAGHVLKGMEGVYTNYQLNDLKQIIPWQKELYAEMIECVKEKSWLPSEELGGRSSQQRT